MRFTPLEIPDVLLIEPTGFEDPRGEFFEAYHKQRFRTAGVDAEFVQDNQSMSRRGVLRGLHYQIRGPQGKLVRVLAGEIHDVVVDLRRGSKTFSRSVGIALAAKTRHQLWIPPGFAHGFYVLTDIAEVLYKVTDYYAPEWERTLLWNDPALNLRWPLLNGEPPLLSEKDARGKPLAEAEIYEDALAGR